MNATCQQEQTRPQGQCAHIPLKRASLDSLIDCDQLLLAELLDLASVGDRDIQSLWPTIRQMILDHVFAGECGDCIADNEFDKRIDELVERVMDWLIKTRQEARRGVGSMTQ